MGRGQECHRRDRRVPKPADLETAVCVNCQGHRGQLTSVREKLPAGILPGHGMYERIASREKSVV
jgi:hypothetical protein